MGAHIKKIASCDLVATKGMGDRPRVGCCSSALCCVVGVFGGYWCPSISGVCAFISDGSGFAIGGGDSHVSCVVGIGVMLRSCILLSAFDGGVLWVVSARDIGGVAAGVLIEADSDS